MTLPRLSDLHHRLHAALGHRHAVLSGAAGIVVTALAMTGITACDNGCEQTRENYLHIAFSPTSGRVMKQVGITYQSGINIVSAGSYASFDDIKVDINPNEQLTRLYIESTYSDYGDSFTERDTIDVAYHVDPRFLDMECGCTVTFNITDVTSTHNLLGHITVNDSEVMPESGINLTIDY